MIKLLKEGHYKLIETKSQTKILTLDEDNYAWINASGIGEILVASHHPYQTDNILVVGKYRLYEIKDEPELTDLEHLELFAGEGVWQGYLLTGGLPTDQKLRKRIIPTSELITKTSYIKGHNEN